MLTSVDLPAPLRPTRAWVRRGWMRMPASSRATVVPYRLVMPAASTSARAGCAGAPAAARVASLIACSCLVAGCCSSCGGCGHRQIVARCGTARPREIPGSGPAPEPSADVVAPQGLVVTLEAFHPTVGACVGGHQRRAELVLQQTRSDLDDGAVVV